MFVGFGTQTRKATTLAPQKKVASAFVPSLDCDLNDL